MVLRFLLIGSPHERAAFKHATRTGIGPDSVFRLEFDEFIRFSGAIEHVDSSDFPTVIVTTPSAILEQAIDLLAHVRGCRRSVPFILWRRSLPNAEEAAMLDRHSGRLVTSDDPLHVTAVVLENLETVLPAAAPSEAAAPV